MTDYSLVVTRQLKASPAAVYRAWTTGFEAWFAAPGTAAMRPIVGEPFYFATEFEGAKHPHYGRFVRLEQDTLVEITWVTGRDGTDGAETVVTVELAEGDNGGTALKLTHAGFYNEVTMYNHATAWEQFVLPHLDEVLSGEATR